MLLLVDAREVVIRMSRTQFSSTVGKFYQPSHAQKFSSRFGEFLCLIYLRSGLPMQSVSTVALKYQAHHPFHIFKFDVQDCGLRTT